MSDATKLDASPTGEVNVVAWLRERASECHTEAANPSRAARARLDQAAAGIALDAAATELHRLLRSASEPRVPSAAERRWPDLGADPMKGDRAADRYEDACKRVREAYVKQQPHVPNQTALVWRYDIGTLLETAIRLKSILADDGDQAVDRPNDEQRALSKAVEPWKDYHGDLPDYDHPLRCVFESGIQYAVVLLAKELGVEDWTPCEGTEEFDGDLGGTMMNIVCASLPEDEHGDRMHPRDVHAAFASPVAGGEVEPYLVWSNEHQAWWGKDRCGYTRHIERAGRYDRAGALTIAGTRDGGWHIRRDNPAEIAIPERDAVEQYAAITAAFASPEDRT